MLKIAVLASTMLAALVACDKPATGSASEPGAVEAAVDNAIAAGNEARRAANATEEVGAFSNSDDR
ncbi:hypothetical protein [Sphingomonas quercus]|uniref:Lipoprotein n=1 Tax=Sphingomonas quercus TaxID=2842451 RepID=A0ABS6BGC9_9SPHN|nr:hypothetical protein [Sphingomonas quercus]MBU3077358.1 hypothetical protein [Sphingomonas quercus]